jgi:hypothetical protein
MRRPSNSTAARSFEGDDEPSSSALDEGMWAAEWMKGVASCHSMQIKETSPQASIASNSAVRRARGDAGGLMPDVLLTDIDGTLVDSNALHAEAWRRTFEHFGIQIRLDEAWREIGKGGDQLIPVFVPEVDRERLEKPLMEFRRDLFHRDYISRMVAFPQARELLLRVKQSGTKIALATSSDQEDLALYGRLVGMDDLVDEASSSGDAKLPNPMPISSPRPLRRSACKRNKLWLWVTHRGTPKLRANCGFQ